MADARQRPRLAQKCLAAIGGRELGPEDLDGLVAIQQDRVREVHDTHPALAELAHHPVVGRNRTLQPFHQQIWAYGASDPRVRLIAISGAAVWAVWVRAARL